MKKNSSIPTTIIAALFIGIIALLCATYIRETASFAFTILKNPARIISAKDDFETKLNADFPVKNVFVDTNGLFHRFLLQRRMNEVVRLKNGYETIPMENRSEETISANADSLKAFSEYLDQKNIYMFYCQLPYKNADGNSQLPFGLVDYSNDIADSFVSKLHERGVDCLDLRESIKVDGIDLYSLFLRVEHHWNPYGGFYAFTKLCAFMEDNYGIKADPDVLDLDNYYQDTYKRFSLGYYGQRTGFLFGGFDDFTVIYPKFETVQTCEIPNKEIFRSGSFSDTVFDLGKMELPWRERGLYPMYIGGDFPLVLHHSETAQNDSTVMIFIDSFGTIPEAYLTTAFKTVVAVDLRWVQLLNIGKTAADIVEEYSPDIVIIMHNPSQIGSSADSAEFSFGIN